ncbi:MAG: hypothetical protein U9Q17_03630 [Chloroflexota bacterium]|nr:hypothetical protein [Chloroflexota bacterium]
MSNKQEPELEPEPQLDETGEERFPVDTAILKSDLKAFGIRAPGRVASYLAQGDLSDPFWLNQALADMNCDVNTRKPFIKFWLNRKGSVLPPELETRLSPETARENEQKAERTEAARSKYSVDETTGVIRVATSGERALSWAEAQHLSQNIKQALAEGKSGDPMDTWIEQQTKMAQFKEALGLGTQEKITVGEIVGVLKDLQGMVKAKEEKPVLPGWLSDPLQFIQAVKAVAGPKPVDSQPSWLSDPAQFVRTARELNSEGKGDNAVKAELSELRKVLTDMQEDRHREEIAGLQSQIHQQANAYQQQIDQVSDRLESMKPAGRTELDLLHDIAAEGIGTIKTEAVGMRNVIKDAIAGGLISPPHIPQMPAQPRQRGLRTEKDIEIEALGRRLFFGEGNKEPPPPPKTQVHSTAEPTNAAGKIVPLVYE